MQEQLEKIRVENFKSLKDFEIELGKFNVLIGPNGSGKTNVLELFKFINLCINPNRVPPYPFTPWWGFNNIVWSGKEDLPVSFSMQYAMFNTQMNYSATISGSGGKFSFLSENFAVENLVEINRDFNTVEYVFDKNFIEKHKDEISNPPSHIKETNPEELFSPKPHVIPNHLSIFRHHAGWSATYSNNHQICIGHLSVTEQGQRKDVIPFVSPLVERNNETFPLYPRVEDFLTVDNRIILLRQLNFNAIRQPSPVGKNPNLSEDGDGLVNLLFQWYTQNSATLPDRITHALEELFPNWQIVFTVTDDGRIMLNVKDGDLTLSPTSIPDGFYKLLIVLVAIELNPRILLIDEVDTSLHAKIIEYLISAFKTSAPTVIVTTHSPLVIDLVDLEDLILLEREAYETKSHRIQDPHEMQKRLREKGITASESWLYAKL